MFYYLVAAVADSMNPVTLGMMGWAAVMTLTVGIIVAAIIIRHRRAAPSTDIESPAIVKTERVQATDDVAEVHVNPKNIHKSTDQNN